MWPVALLLLRVELTAVKCGFLKFRFAILILQLHIMHLFRNGFLPLFFSFFSFSCCFVCYLKITMKVTVAEYREPGSWGRVLWRAACRPACCCGCPPHQHGGSETLPRRCRSPTCESEPAGRSVSQEGPCPPGPPAAAARQNQARLLCGVEAQQSRFWLAASFCLASRLTPPGPS